jgi:RNA polymerase sigma-32 factor
VLSEQPKTLQELGEEFGLSRERVRQLEARLVARLREYLKENLVDFEYYTPSKVE